MEEFSKRYNRLASTYGDPLENLFKMLNSDDVKASEKIGVANILLKYRYADKKIIEISLEDEILNQM